MPKGEVPSGVPLSLKEKQKRAVFALITERKRARILTKSMKTLLYKGHSVIYGAALDGFTGKYAPTGQISWQSPARKHSFTLSKLFSTAQEATAVAVEEAIARTDDRLAYETSQ
jgi:hypothetical protein